MRNQVQLGPMMPYCVDLLTLRLNVEETEDEAPLSEYKKRAVAYKLKPCASAGSKSGEVFRVKHCQFVCVAVLYV